MSWKSRSVKDSNGHEQDRSHDRGAPTRRSAPLNKLERIDEKPFEVVSEASLRGEKAYSLFVPAVHPTAGE